MNTDRRSSLGTMLAVAALVSVCRVATAQAPAAPIVDGEVRKVDKGQGKLTLKHGPIPNLGMSGMTMVFRVADPKMLEAVKAGDKVRFTADKVDGSFTVTSIDVVK